jgi:hypothetical protein
MRPPLKAASDDGHQHHALTLVAYAVMKAVLDLVFNGKRANDTPGSGEREEQERILQSQGRRC